MEVQWITLVFSVTSMLCYALLCYVLDTKFGVLGFLCVCVCVCVCVCCIWVFVD